MSDLYSISQEHAKAKCHIRPFNDIPYTLFFAWEGFLAGDCYRLALKKLLEAIKQYNVRYILHDYRFIRVIHPSDQIWFSSYFLPRLNDTNVLYSAMVRPLDDMASSCLTSMARKYDGDIEHEVEMFDDFDTAHASLIREAFP